MKTIKFKTWQIPMPDGWETEPGILDVDDVTDQGSVGSMQNKSFKFEKI